MRRYLGIAVGLGLLVIMLSATNAGPAMAQTFKPVMALITNDSANPVPVRVIAAPQATVICTASLGGVSLPGPIVDGNCLASDALVACPEGVTGIDVTRVAYTPDVVSGLGNSNNVVHYRVTVTHKPTDPFPPTGPTGQDILAVLTDGAPEAAVMRPFRFDKAAGGVFHNLITASAGIAGVPVAVSGTLIIIGTPVQ